MARKKRQQLIALVSVVTLAYLVLIGLGVRNLMKKEKEASAADADAKALEPEVADLRAHLSKWSELDPITDIEHFPVETLWQVSRISPATGLNFERAEIKNQIEIADDGKITLQRRVTIIGKATELSMVNLFSESLHKSKDLAYYEWNTPEATQIKDGRWSFNYNGTPKFGEGTN